MSDDSEEGWGIRHKLVRVGDALPCPRTNILHIASRETNTGIDIWWYGFAENNITENDLKA